MSFLDHVEIIGKSKTNRLILFMVASSIILFSVLDTFKYYSFSYYDFDLAIFNQVMWNTLHDGFFNSTIITGGNYLGQQMTPILILFLPLYALLQSPLCLLFVQSLFLGLGAIPLYLVVRDRLGEKWGVAFAALYLLHPTVASMNLFEFHTNSFEPFLFFSSFYFLFKRKYSLFIAGIFLCLLCKEDAAFPVFMLGVYAWLSGHEKRYFLLPILLSVGYFTLVFFFVMPALGSDQYLYLGSESFGRYSHLGNGIWEIIRNAVTNPLSIVRYTLSTRNLIYVAQMLAFSGFLPLFSPDVLIIALPSIMENLLSSTATQTDVIYQYSSAITPFLLLASAFSIERLQRWLSPLPRYGGILKAFLLVTLCTSLLSSVAYNPLFDSHTYDGIFAPDRKDEARMRLLGMIPPDGVVMATFNFLPRLSGRRNLYSYHLWYLSGNLNLKGIPLEESEVRHILIDFDDTLMNSLFESSDGEIRQANLLQSSRWGLVAISENMVLLERDYESTMTIESLLMQANREAGEWVRYNTKKDDVLFASTISSYAQYASETSGRIFINFSPGPDVSHDLSRIEGSEHFGKDIFLQVLVKYGVSYIYVPNKFGKTETRMLGTDESVLFSKPRILASYPERYKLVFENAFVRIYRIIYTKAFNARDHL